MTTTRKQYSPKFKRWRWRQSAGKTLSQLAAVQGSSDPDREVEEVRAGATAELFVDGGRASGGMGKWTATRSTKRLVG